MGFWIEIVCFNATSAVFLAAAAWFVSRRVQRPALAHTLWLLVLLRLVAPPLVPIERVPRMSWLAARLAGATEPSTAPAPMAILPAAPPMVWLPPSFDTAVTSPTEHEPGASARRATAATASRRSGGAEDEWLRSRLVAVVICIAIVGAFFIMSRTLLRARRFRRHLRHAPEASHELQARVGELARLLGVRRLPKIRVVPQHIPPSLWPRLWGCEIVLPAALLPHLTADERDLLIAHELAHVHRHDPWIRPVEQAIVALYWWHPLAWWARRHLRAEEEKSCDAVVVAKLPHLARAYAEAVLKTLEFLAVKRSAFPEFATGAGGIMRLEERMKSILSANVPRPASMRLRLSLLLPAVLAVLVAPAWVQNADGVGARAESQQVGDSMQQHREELRLRQEMHALETRRMQIQLQIEEIMMQREQERMRAELQRLEQEGATEEAAALRRHLAETEAEAELRREQMRFESAYAQKREVLEFELQDLSIQRDELSRRGDEAKAQELDVRAEEIARQLKALELDAMRAEIERSRKQLDRTTRELEALSKP